MEPFEIMISESQERMLCVVEPRAAGRGAGRLPRAGRPARRRSARSPTPSGCACSTASELVGDMPVAALVDECPLYDLEPAGAGGPAGRSSRRRGRGSRRTRQPRRRCARCSARRTSPAGGGCSSSTTAWSAAARCAGPSRRTRRCCGWRYDGRRHRPGARGVDRRQRAPGGLRPLHRRRRGGLRVRRQPRLRGRRAARPHQLPQLRQPREAARRLAADPRGRGHGGRLPGARRAGRGRQRLALQRGPGGPDLPDPGRRHGRRAARPGRAPARARSARPARASPTWSR